MFCPPLFGKIILNVSPIKLQRIKKSPNQPNRKNHPSQIYLGFQRSTWIHVFIWSKIFSSHTQISLPDSFCMKSIYSLRKLNILYNKAMIVFDYRCSDENCLILKHCFLSDFATRYFLFQCTVSKITLIAIFLLFLH